MKKNWKRIFTSLLACVIMFSTLSFTASAEEGEYLMFLAYGGDSEEEEWAFSWANESANESGIEGTTAMVKEGETVTIGLEMPSESANTWYMAPILVAEGVGSVDYTIDKITLDGTDITDTLDLSAGKSFWYEATGDYSDTEAVRLAGGYNEWGDKYLPESPAGFTKIEYTITLNSITFGEMGGEIELSTESYPAFIAFGGDIESDGAWDAQYYGDGAAGNTEGVVGVDGELKNGEITTLSVTFPEEIFQTWFTAPCFVAENSALISPESTFEIQVLLDGKEIDVDLSAGKSVWAEGTGDFAEGVCLRTGGGYNAWGDNYWSDYNPDDNVPSGFKELTYIITPTIYVSEAEEEISIDFDENGTYHAYLGVQTPTWVFRNGFDDDTYGLESEYFDDLGIVEDGTWTGQGGTFTDVEVAGNGTYTVALNGYDFSDQLGDDGLFNLLFLSTDLPINDDVVISDLVVKMDGSVILEQDTGVQDKESKEFQKILFANIWNDDVEEMPFFSAPKDSIEITFTVSGFAYDSDGAAEEEEEVIPEETPAASSEEVVEEPPVEAKSNTALIVIIVIVVVVAVVAVILVSKKKKESK